MSGIRNKWLELNLTGALYNSKCIQNRPSQCLRKRTLFSYKKKKIMTVATLCRGISMEYRPTYRNCCLNVQKSKTELDKNKSS